MLQYPHDSSSFVFSGGRKKTSSSTSDPYSSPSKSKNFNPNSSVTRKLSVDTDLSAPRRRVLSPSRPSSPQARSTHSSQIEDILSPGDLVGEGIPLLGEVLRLASIRSPERPPVANYEDPAAEFEVVRQLGTGSDAVVYLVREVLSRDPPSEDDHVYPGGRLELDDTASLPLPTEYGRQYAIKVLSRADFFDLDEEELVAQFTEVGIRYLQSFLALKSSFSSCHSPVDEHLPVPSCTSQHCDVAPDLGDLGLPHPPSRIRSRSRSLSLSGTDPRSLRRRSYRRSGAYSYSTHARPAFVSSPVSDTIAHPSPPYRLDVCPNVRGCSHMP